MKKGKQRQKDQPTFQRPPSEVLGPQLLFKIKVHFRYSNRHFKMLCKPQTSTTGPCLQLTIIQISPWSTRLHLRDLIDDLLQPQARGQNASWSTQPLANGRHSSPEEGQATAGSHRTSQKWHLPATKDSECPVPTWWRKATLNKAQIHQELYQDVSALPDASLKMTHRCDHCGVLHHVLNDLGGVPGWVKGWRDTCVCGGGSRISL